MTEESVAGASPLFADHEGVQPYSKGDIPQDRELVTTPYDAPVKTLADEIQAKDLILNPDFQRQSVWDKGRKSRLIESLLLNIPIPVCFFAEDDDGKRVVVDGQQRLRAIEEFKSGQFRLERLQVLADLNGKRWADLTPRQSRIIDNRTIRCIIISHRSDPNIRFEVFERLNTGVVPLTDQELRNCVYRGPFNAMLEELVNDERWLRLIRKSKPDTRLRHHELILRFFALEDVVRDYRPPLKKILNDFMRAHRRSGEPFLKEKKDRFLATIERVDLAFGSTAFRAFRESKTRGASWQNAINRAVFDIQMLALAGVHDSVISSAGDLRSGFGELCLQNAEFSDAIGRATADRSKFYTRLSIFVEFLNERGIASPLRGSIPKP